MNARRLTLATVVLLCVLVGALALASVPASALNSYALSSSFGEPGSGAGQLSSPGGVAANEVTHDVYVADTGNQRVDEFSATGAFIRAWGWGVVDGLPQFEVCTVVCQAGISGNGVGQLESPTYVAVDNSGGASEGDVYVTNGGLVAKFDASGNVVSGWGSGGQLDGSTVPGGAFGDIGGIAVDGGGTLLVSVFGPPPWVVFEFAQDGSFVAALPRSPVLFDQPGFAVDAAGDLFGNYFGGVQEYAYTSTGISYVGRLIAGNGIIAADFIAVDSVTHELFLTGGEHVEQYVLPGSGKVSEPDGSTCTASHEETNGGCVPTSSFGVGGMRAQGIGVDSANGTGTVYVIDGASGKIDVFTMPVLASEWVSGVTSTGATLNAIVNPLRSSTQYSVEYGTSTSYGQTVSGSAGEGLGDVHVTRHLEGLVPSTVYHYRIVTHSAVGTVESADHTFTTQPVGAELSLLDGREWELVSPPDKKGALIELFPAGGIIQAAGDGSAITYVSSEIVGEGALGKDNFPQVLSSRGVGGWGSRALTIPHHIPIEESAAKLSVGSFEYQFFSSDLSSAVVLPQDVAVPLSPEATDRTVYVRNNVTGSFVPMVYPGDIPPGTQFFDPKANEGPPGMLFDGATPDASHVLLSTSFALTPEAIGVAYRGGQNLYEWSAGRLQLVNILPNGKASGGRAELGRIETFTPSVKAMSSDGRWVVWHEFEPSSLYVRDMVGGRTVQMGGAHALFDGISSDGSKVFFVEGGDLYEFDTGSDATVDLTAHRGAGEPNAGVQTYSVSLLDGVRVSEDGSYVYLVATGVLADGGVSGANNLYALHDEGGVWSTRYVGALSGEDENLNYSRVSPNGRYLVFMSNRSLTGYDNLDVNSGLPDQEVFLYDAVEGRLVCASCNPTGEPPVGVHDIVPPGLLADQYNEAKWSGNWLAGSLSSPEFMNRFVMSQPRSVSDSGRVFFNSPDALVAQDTNGLMDVYEYEPAGVGGCSSGDRSFSERSGGCVDLISSGTSSAESVFMDASENGDDAFFVTSSRLTAADYDTSYDMYDAHVCSSSVPCAAVPVSPPECTTADSCKAAPSPQPEIFGPAPSATFSGIGNIVEAKKSVVKRKVKPKHPKRKKKRKGKKARQSIAGRARSSHAGGSGVSGGRRSS